MIKIKNTKQYDLEFRILLIFSSIIIVGLLSSACGAEDVREKREEIVKAEEVSVPERESPEKETIKKYDFSDLSNWNLTVSAWECLAGKDYEGVFAYTAKCLEIYEEKARDMAKAMRGFATLGHEDDYAVVNDVATCHYIMGEAYMKQDKFDEAIREFNIVIEEYPYAICWDPKGWFWKVAEVSKKNIEKIKTQMNADFKVAE